MVERDALTSESGEVTPSDASLIEVGNAADLTEGTSTRSGTEDKRYKYQ